MKQSLDKFVVIKTTGEVVELDTLSYEDICQYVGSPFDTARIAQGFELYIRDEGLFDGSYLNVPLAFAFGLPIMGDVILHGGADRHGNTIKAWYDGRTSEDGSHFKHLLEVVCPHLWSVWQQVEANRATPFTISTFNPETGEFEEMP